LSLLPGCDLGSRDNTLLDAPPVNILDLQAVTHVVGGVPAYESVSPDGSTQVYGTTAFKITFDRFLAPISVSRQALCVRPSFGNVGGPADCTGGVVFAPSYDPVRREAMFRLDPAQAPLSHDDIYTLTAYVGLTPDAGGFRSFEGTPITSRFTREFRVRPGAGAPDPVPTDDHFCTSARPTCASDCALDCQTMHPGDPTCTSTCKASCPRSVSQAFAGCALGNCHAGASADGTNLPAEGLDLSSVAALLATAIGHTAHETQTGEHAEDPDENPPRFGRAMPILDPNFPGNSYLLYKLLASHDTPLVDPPDPVELGRLRRSVVVGMPMPPSTAPSAFLRPGEAEWISAWLGQGAPTPPCH
jgi:hypothetical protein